MQKPQKRIAYEAVFFRDASVKFVKKEWLD